MYCINGVLIKVDQSSAHNVVKKIKLVVTPEAKKTDFDGICRICLNNPSESDLFNLFDSNQFFKSMTISTAIEECFGVSIRKDDNLSSCVCFQCATSTLQAYTFKKLIVKGEEALKTQANDISPIMTDYDDNKNALMIRTSSPVTVSNNESFIESYECSLTSIASDHNYTKELMAIELLTPSISISTPDPITKEEEVNDSIDIDVNLINNTLKKFSRKPLSSTLDKWWIKSSGPPYECKLCSRNYGSFYNSFYRHVRTHFMNKLSCSLCGKKYTKDKLKIHMLTHNKEKPFPCDQCPAQFTIQANLKRHSTVHTGLKPYICDICSKGFTQNSSMQAHRQAHIGTTEIICEYCGKAFGTRYYRHHKLRYHMNRNIKEKPNTSDKDETYECDQCDRVFSKLGALHQHSTRVHQENEIYRCDICTLDIRMKFRYNVHMFIHELQTSTSDSVAYDCKFCLDTFSNKTNLEEHLLQHIEKPHQCNQCYKFFANRSNLIHHTRQHSEERPYPCKDCGKTFRNSTTLYQHKKIHSGRKPHLCQICLRSFTQQQHLTSHMLTHTGEKKYVCQYCGKAFALNGNLTVHIRRHTGDTPFYCKICGKGFHDTSSRKKHMHWKHNDECKQEECVQEYYKEENL